MMQEVTDNNAVVRAITSLKTDILTELQLLTKKIKEDAEDEKMSSEWKLMAMVVDRLCFYVFFVSFVIVIVVFSCKLF